MDRLPPHETALLGQWITRDGRVIADKVCERIERLLRTELALMGGGSHYSWTELFRDRQDGRYWERAYQQSEMHGGGLPMLANVTGEELAARYGICE